MKLNCSQACPDLAGLQLGSFDNPYSGVATKTVVADLLKHRIHEPVAQREKLRLGIPNRHSAVERYRLVSLGKLAFK